MQSLRNISMMFNEFELLDRFEQAEPDDAAEIVGIMNPIITAGIYTAFDTPFTPESEREYILKHARRTKHQQPGRHHALRTDTCACSTRTRTRSFSPV